MDKVRICLACGGDDGEGPLEACPGCRARLHRDCRELSICPGCQRVELPVDPEVPEYRPASLLRRLAAIGLDTALMTIPAIAALGVGLGAGMGATAAIALATAAALLTQVVNVALFLGEGGATLGKKLVGLRVLDRYGMPLGWAAALRREFLFKAGSELGLGAGFLPLLTGGDQALHDRAVGGRVVQETRATEARPRLLGAG